MPFPSPGDLPNLGIEPTSPALAGRFFTVSATRETQASHFFGNLLDPTSPTEQVFLYQVAFPYQNPVSDSIMDCLFFKNIVTWPLHRVTFSQGFSLRLLYTPYVRLGRQVMRLNSSEGLMNGWQREVVKNST